MSIEKPIGFSGRVLSQREDEMQEFLSILRRNYVRSYLEIGAREGDMFHEVMTNLPRGARGIAVDLPGALWGKKQSRELLDKAIADLIERGYNVRAIYGSSHDEAVIREVSGEAPFDAVFIDADHTYAAVLRDWLDYGSLGKIVAFHDIDGFGEQTKAGEPVQVPELWSDLERRFRSQKIVGKVRGMGIGVLYVQEPIKP